MTQPTGQINKVKNIAKFTAVALAACCLALLPLAVFAVGDAASFQAVEHAQQAYTPVQPTGDDFYLLRLLRSRIVARVGNQQQTIADKPDTTEQSIPSFYLSAQTSRDGMMPNPYAGEYALATLQNMVDCGGLSQEWADAVTLQMKRDPSAFYTSADTLGLVTISYFIETGNTYSPITLFSVTTDGKTGAVVSLFLTDTQPHASSDTKKVLTGFVQQAGLSSLADWAAPVGTSYENSGVYSVQGEALATCATGKYVRSYGAGDAPARYYYSLMLSTMQPNQIGVAEPDLP